MATWLERGWAVTDCRGKFLQPFTSLSDDGTKEGLPHGGVPPLVGLLKVGIMYTVSGHVLNFLCAYNDW